MRPMCEPIRPRAVGSRLHTSLPLGGRWLGVIVMARIANAVRPCQWGKRLGAVDAHGSHPQGHSHATIIVRATVPNAVAVCDTGALGYSIRHSPGDVCGVAMRAGSFVASDAGTGQGPEPPQRHSHTERASVRHELRAEGGGVGEREALVSWQQRVR